MVNNPEEEYAFRYERKFWLDYLPKEQLEHYIKTNSACFSEIFWERQINNIYFDTSNLKYYLENINGEPNRVKVRIRWYDDLEQRIKNPTLEIKIKRGLVGTKQAFPLKTFTFKPSINKEIFTNVLSKSKLPEDILELVKILEPKLVNSYTRKYFLSNNGKFRATIDTNLNFRAINNLSNNFITKYCYKSPTILELKYDRRDEKTVSAITQEFPFRMSKSSKYVVGINTVANHGY